jgi:hypothetical protein
VVKPPLIHQLYAVSQGTNVSFPLDQRANAMADIDEMTDEELEAAYKARKAAAVQRKIAAKAAVGKAARAHLDTYLPGYLRRTYPNNPEYHGLKLQDVFTAGDGRPSHFVKPAANQTYSGRGMPPKWYQDLSIKDRRACKVYLDAPADAPEEAPAPAPARPARQQRNGRQAAHA